LPAQRGNMDGTRFGSSIRSVSASGSHHQIGRSLGKVCGDQARRMAERFKALFPRSDGTDRLAMALSNARKTLPYAREYCPECVEELEGYAEGSGVDFETVYALFCDHDVWEGKGCTDIAVNEQWTRDDCVYAAHNEDVPPYNLEDVTIVRVRPKGAPAFIGVSYGGIMPTVGMSDAGISITGNAVVPNDTRVGIPKMLVVRKVLAARGLHEALSLSMPKQRGHSFNNIISDASGEIYSMEGSATTFDALYADEGYLVHANHYLSPRMWRFEEDMHTRISSIIRYNRARKLFRRELGKVDLSTFKQILSDHVGYPESICRHPDPAQDEEEQTMSIFSAVFDLTNRAAWICAGNPCEGSFEKHEL
jgi:isopenicillin-N N-acyltransferase-like protein